MVKIYNTYKLAAREGSSTLASQKLIIAHSTANPNTSAKNNAAYEKRTWNNAYVHFIVDDTGAYSVGAVPYVAWGAGGTANQRALLQVELCEFTDKKKARKAYENYVNLIRQYAKKYNVSLTLDSENTTNGVKTHKWVSNNFHQTDHTDPVGYLSSVGISQAQFAKDLKNGFSSKKTTTKEKTYMVKKGDTLYSIAKANKISLQTLKTKNNLKNNLIRIGQILKV